MIKKILVYLKIVIIVVNLKISNKKNKKIFCLAIKCLFHFLLTLADFRRFKTPKCIVCLLSLTNPFIYSPACWTYKPKKAVKISVGIWMTHCLKGHTASHATLMLGMCSLYIMVMVAIDEFSANGKRLLKY